jgi:hypothetical protein
MYSRTGCLESSGRELFVRNGNENRIWLDRALLAASSRGRALRTRILIRRYHLEAHREETCLHRQVTVIVAKPLRSSNDAATF